MALGNYVNAGTTGFQSLNASTGVWNGRSLTPGTGISITNQDGTGGNPVISATGGFSPNSTVNLSDEFTCMFQGGSYIVSEFQWYCMSGGTKDFTPSTSIIDNGHPGVLANAATNNGVRGIIFSSFDSAAATNYTSFILG